MAFNLSQRQIMAAIVNRALAESEFKHLSWKADSFSAIDSPKGFIRWDDPENNPVTEIFKKTSPNRYKSANEFYHFKSLAIVKKIIQDKSIQVSNLLSNDENDFAEYSEFYKRLGLFHKLLPKNFCEQAQQRIFDPSGKSIIEEERENIFILCVTNDTSNELFWENYAKKDTGVCIAFKFLAYNPNFGHLYDFRDVCYDNGYSFDFLNHINYHFVKKFGRHLFVEGNSKFSKFYKRSKYAWEKETRLAFNYHPSSGNEITLKAMLPIQSDSATNRKYIDLPLIAKDIDNFQFAINPFFTLTISEIICGKSVSVDDMEELTRLLKIYFPFAVLSQRK